MKTSTFKGTKGKWFTYFNKLSTTFKNGEWQVKAMDTTLTPVLLVPEAAGGKKEKTVYPPIKKLMPILHLLLQT